MEIYIYIHISLDGLVCSIAEYLNELRRILTSPWASQNINNARESRSRKHHTKCQRIVLHETLRYQTLSSNSINLIADTAELCISSKRSNSVSRNETD